MIETATNGQWPSSTVDEQSISRRDFLRGVGSVVVGTALLGVAIPGEALAATNYVGTYTLKTYASRGKRPNMGALAKGALKSTRSVTVSQYSRSAVRFRVAYSTPSMTKSNRTNWIVARLKKGSGTFTYRAMNGETGKGTIKLKSGKLTLKMTTTSRGKAQNTMGMSSSIKLKKGANTKVV